MLKQIRPSIPQGHLGGYRELKRKSGKGGPSDTTDRAKFGTHITWIHMGMDIA